MVGKRKVVGLRTISYYKNLFSKFLEGGERSKGLVEEVVDHESEWLRNVCKHYTQYLNYGRKISPELFGWIMEVAP